MWPAAIGDYDNLVYDDKTIGHVGSGLDMLDILFLIIYIAAPIIAVPEQQAMSLRDQYYHGNELRDKNLFAADLKSKTDWRIIILCFP